jgi:nucleotide-binding universal stress UspA family protein
MQLLALRRVLAAIDMDGSSQAAWTSARDLAAAAGSELHVLHVAQNEEQPASIEGELERIGIARGAAEIHVLPGDPARAIGLTADKIGADVIVLGPHRRQAGGTRSAGGLGSTALAVVTNSDAPCLVATSPLRLPLGEVVVAVDLSDTARGALLVALSWASALRRRDGGATSLTALHVMDAESPADVETRERAIEEALAPTREAAGDWSGVTINTQIVRAGNAVDGIAAHVETHSPQLVALGTRGLGLDSVGRIGSVASEVMRRVGAPILLVPPAMWKSHARD